MLVNLFRLLSHLPLRVLHALGMALGWLVYLAAPGYRRRLKDNITLAGHGTHLHAAIAEAGIAVQVVNKVTEGRPHIVDMIKMGDIAMVINTVEERRNAIADSRAIRTSSLLARVTTFTTIFGAEAAVEGMKSMNNLEVYSVQELHAQLAQA